jgi:hypothetical protein
VEPRIGSASIASWFPIRGASVGTLEGKRIGVEIRILKQKKGKCIRMGLKREYKFRTKSIYGIPKQKRAYTLKRANKIKFSRVKDAFDKSKNGKKKKRKKRSWQSDRDELI